MAITDYFLIDNQAVDTTEVEYVVPANVLAITFQPRGCNVQMRLSAAASDYYTLYDGIAFPFQNRNIAGKSLFFDVDADSGVMEVFAILGSGA